MALYNDILLNAVELLVQFYQLNSTKHAFATTDLITQSHAAPTMNVNDAVTATTTCITNVNNWFTTNHQTT